MTTKPKPGGVSLSGKTRLTMREAVALMYVSRSGQEANEYLPIGERDERLIAPAKTAFAKLKQAVIDAGGYRDDGTLIDPFEGGEG